MDANVVEFPGQRPALMTKAEVADRWQVSQRTVERYRKDHGLPAMKLTSGAVRFFRADVEAFERRNRQAS